MEYMSTLLIQSNESNNSSIGTGFVIYQDKFGSYVLTCAHVIEEVVSPKVDNYRIEVKAKGSSETIDLAVLYIKDFFVKPLELQSRKCSTKDVSLIGYSIFNKDKYQEKTRDATILGDSIILKGTKKGKIYKAWQIVANNNYEIESGNSGSPLICNDSGQVIGVVTHNSKAKREGYAISIEHLKEVWLDMPYFLIRRDSRLFLIYSFLKNINKRYFLGIFLILTLLLGFMCNETNACYLFDDQWLPAKKNIDYNGDEIEWIKIEGGVFLKGYYENRHLRYHQLDEKLMYVQLSTFLISKTEVTVSQYHKCVLEKGCKIPENNEQDYCFYGRERFDNYPVNCISWKQAEDYAKFIGARLPTEAEWEFAASSRGKLYPYPWGNVLPTCKYAIMDAKSGDGKDSCGKNHPWEVCSRKQGNTMEGLCDMAGNVYEFVDDWYAENPEINYTKENYDNNDVLHNPKGPREPNEYKQKVIKGGDCTSTTINAFMRNVNRGWRHSVGEKRHGFRVVKDLGSI